MKDLKLYAIKGIMGNQVYYTSMVTYSTICEMFIYPVVSCLPERRSQRLLNEERIPEIVSYIINNRDTYVFPALTISFKGEYKFNAITGDLGFLEIRDHTQYMINDGQHRIEAIKQAVALNGELENETIAVVLFTEGELKRNQQIFTDLNKHSYRATNSISTLYDERDPFNKLMVEIVDQVDFLRKYIDKERDTIGKNSKKLYTLAAFKSANNGFKKYTISCKNFLLDYWTTLCNSVMPWRQLLTGDITKVYIRENTILSVTITLKAFARLSMYFYDNGLDLTNLKSLEKIQWQRDNELWKKLVYNENGNIIASDLGVQNIYLYLLQYIIEENNL